MTDETSQIEIPPSFLRLYVPAGHHRPQQPWGQVLADYELCEDMAQMLAPVAADQAFQLGVTEQDVLARCHHGLRTEPCVLNEAQSYWVVQRIAEILSWPWPSFKNLPSK
jgi:hypothetical protein